MMKTIIVLAAIIHCATATPIDNGVNGEPEIECGPESIQVTFNTKNKFTGHVYVKGRFAETPACRTDGNGVQAVGNIELKFTDCGVTRERSLNPKGVFVRSTIVISFHPRFLTKIDRAYTVQCFYMEADKTVSTGIEVSEITTGFQTQVVPMPVCRYEILSAAQNGQPVKFAIIGQGVFHKWTCDTDTTDTFCMTVHSCFVDDGQGDRLDILTESGCAIDKYLMGNPEYPSDLMAVKEVHVFKYADRPALQFQCQITILVKDPGQACGRPQCQEPGGQGDGSAPSAASAPAAKAAPAAPATKNATASKSPRDLSDQAQQFFWRRRLARDVSQDEFALGTMDVRSGSIEALDIEEHLPSSAHFVHIRPLNAPSSNNVCLSYSVFIVIASALVVLLVASLVATGYLSKRIEKSTQ